MFVNMVTVHDIEVWMKAYLTVEYCMSGPFFG